MKNYLVISFLIILLTIVGCGNPTTVNTSPTQNSQQSTDKQKIKQTIVSNTNDSIQSKHYTNARFGYSIDYPSSFTIQKESENGDGMIFSTSDMHSTLSVYGAYVLDWDLNYFYQQELNSHTNVTYKTKGNNWYVVSWDDGDTIGYTKGIVGKTSISAFTIKYPKSEQQIYSHVIDILSTSFKTHDIDKGDKESVSAITAQKSNNQATPSIKTISEEEYLSLLSEFPKLGSKVVKMPSYMESYGQIKKDYHFYELFRGYYNNLHILAKTTDGVLTYLEISANSKGKFQMPDLSRVISLLTHQYGEPKTIINGFYLWELPSNPKHFISISSKHGNIIGTMENDNS